MPDHVIEHAERIASLEAHVDNLRTDIGELKVMLSSAAKELASVAKDAKLVADAVQNSKDWRKAIIGPGLAAIVGGGLTAITEHFIHR
jgi:peptidoglycan hydrolase CwlO-like protein